MSSHELLNIANEFYPVSTGLPGRVGIVGAGKVGLSIAMKLQHVQALEWMIVRSADRMSQLHMAMPDIKLYKQIESAQSIPDIIVIAVPDAAIESVAEELSIALGPALEGCLVLHCSGSRGLECLSSCERAGALCAAAHPFQTFTHAHERLLNGISWGIECEADVESRVGALVRSLGGTPIILSEYARAHKALYHISAVFASNYVEALIAASRDAAEAAQIPAPLFLQPIIHTAVESAMLSMAHQGRAPLSGPIARGDVETLKRHLEALKEHPSLFRQYCYFALATNEFALQQGYVTEDRYLEIREVLESALLPQIG